MSGGRRGRLSPPPKSCPPPRSGPQPAPRQHAYPVLRTCVRALPDPSHSPGDRDGSEGPDSVLRTQPPAQSGDGTSILEVSRVASVQVHLQPEVQVGVSSTFQHTQRVSLTSFLGREMVFLPSCLKSCHRLEKSPHRGIRFSISQPFIDYEPRAFITLVYFTQ